MKINRANVLFALSIAGMAYAFYVLANKPIDPTAVSIILTISSAVLSWVISDHYAAQQNSARIDGVGERSSEKILNQSKQIWEVEEYVRKQADDLEDFGGAQALHSAREMLKIIRSSNNTYIGDWEGIVSEPVRQKMEERMEAQNKLFRAFAQGATEDRDTNTEIEAEKKALPTYLTPGFPTLSLKLASLLGQDVDRNTTTMSKGRLRVRLNRDSYKFNFTGKLYPELETIPEDLRARIVVRPDSAPQRIAVHAATGTCYDFHVHAKSNEYNVLLPA